MLVNPVRKCTAGAVYGEKEACTCDAEYIAAEILDGSGVEGKHWYACNAHTCVSTMMRIHYLPIGEWWARLREDISLAMNRADAFTESQVREALAMVEYVAPPPPEPEPEPEPVPELTVYERFHALVNGDYIQAMQLVKELANEVMARAVDPIPPAVKEAWAKALENAVEVSDGFETVGLQTDSSDISTMTAEVDVSDTDNESTSIAEEDKPDFNPAEVLLSPEGAATVRVVNDSLPNEDPELGEMTAAEKAQWDTDAGGRGT